MCLRIRAITWRTISWGDVRCGGCAQALIRPTLKLRECFPVGRIRPKAASAESVALPPAHAINICGGIRRRTIPLRRPYHLAEAFHNLVMRIMLAQPLYQRIMRGPDTRRLVDRHLFGNRQVHRQMKEWIGL